MHASGRWVVVLALALGCAGIASSSLAQTRGAKQSLFEFQLGITYPTVRQ